MEWLSDPNIWIGFLTLTILEIVLGIDNIVFISILAGRLPQDQQKKAWQVGLSLALVMRIILLLSISWVMNLKTALFTLPGLNHDVTGKDLILLSGGLFLLYKSVKEIHHKLEGGDEGTSTGKVTSFTAVIVQILALDLVFSLDSVITAVGMIAHVEVMIAAVIIAIIFMMIFAQPVSRFVNAHPSVKMLALAFLVMIGTMLVAEGAGQHIEKGYIYFAMAFSVAVELLNLRYSAKKGKKKVKLLNPIGDEEMVAQAPKS